MNTTPSLDILCCIPAPPATVCVRDVCDELDIAKPKDTEIRQAAAMLLVTVTGYKDGRIGFDSMQDYERVSRALGPYWERRMTEGVKR